MSAQEEIRKLACLIEDDWPVRDDIVCRTTLRWAIARVRYLRGATGLEVQLRAC